MPSVERSTHGCEAVAAERAVRMRMNFASKAMRAKPCEQSRRNKSCEDERRTSKSRLRRGKTAQASRKAQPFDDRQSRSGGRPTPLSFARKKAWQRKRIVAPLRCRGLIDAFLEKSLAKKLNRVTPSTTCVRNMLSTYIGNRAIKNSSVPGSCFAGNALVLSIIFTR